MTPSRFRWALILGLVLNAAHLHAQGTEETPPAPTAPSNKARIHPFPGLRYGSPLGTSLYGGVMLGWENPVGYAGPTLIGEVGQDAIPFT